MNRQAATEPSLGLDCNITRRDFVNTALLGTGMGLLHAPSPAQAADLGKQRTSWPSGSPWTGYGGEGDYAWSNGNTEHVIGAAHGIRDGQYDAAAADVGVDDAVDVAIVGSGFAGLSAALEFQRRMRDGQRCVVLDQHPVFGGEAKQNEFHVGGQRLFGPQGSSEFAVFPVDTKGRYATLAQTWVDLGLPREYAFRDPEQLERKISIPLANYAPMFWQERNSTVGYFFRSPQDGKSGTWQINVWDDDLARTPFSSAERAELLDFYHRRRVPPARQDYGRWLDSMTYRDLLERELGFGPAVTRFADPLVAIGNFGLGCDAVSAYGALRLAMPGAYEMTGQPSRFDLLKLMSFPGGNTAILRAIVKRLIPTAIAGGTDIGDIAEQHIRFDELDRAGQPIRLRQGATVVRVEHDGPVATAQRVLVTYLHNGRRRRLAAHGVIMASGGWVNRRVIRDLPEDLREAYSTFVHAPVLVVNVALRHWRFMERLGIAAGRWFDGFGFHASLRRPMIIGRDPPQLRPDRPIVMTLYVPILNPGHPAPVQASLGRSQLLGQSFREYELQIRRQLVELFGPGGFDPKRDIAGIVLNRWGHAYLAPQPGFFFGTGGQPAPRDVIRRGYGRISFGHSELEGNQNMAHAMLEGHRAAGQRLEEVA